MQVATMLRSLRRIVSLLALGASMIFTCCGVGAAQATPIVLVSATLARSTLNFNYGDNIEVPLPSPQQFPVGFYVRVFRGTKNSLESDGVPVDQGRCREFFSVILLPTVSPQAIHLRGWSDPGWLRIKEGGGGFTDEDYVLVLESGTVRENVLRIRSSALKQYFDSGVELHLTAPGFLERAAESKITEAKHNHEVNLIHLQQERNGPCFGITRIDRSVTAALRPVACSLASDAGF